ncbi:carbohydrate ABC transporter permease [Cohnella zeiphila]|uniref:Carbohydrate ABC transporter permease n=1 Tax=Cohnella zeiphila TaxID=2761120 RepID=A0A7X0VVW7_9BACL|nr:carbohydrate ABC transporter permease [Cohnella zeiphila]MBB6732336.1 carbohydrate ABC transporter permease [Cohnella zeiphila]
MNVTSNRSLGTYSLYGVLIVCSILFLFPLYLAIINSLEDWYSIPVLVPDSFKLSNYSYATKLIDFWRYAGNSVILSGIAVVISSFTSGLVGYAFARIQAPGRGLLFMCVLSTMMLPAIVTQIPTYILLHKIGLINTFLPFLLWAIGGNAFFIFLYRQFFMGIPLELEESARIDGCSIFRTYWNIFLPISIPVVATVMILNFQGSWNDVTGPFMYLKQDQYPLATALSMIGYKANGSTQIIQQVSIAAGLMLIVPVLITFFLGQRYIVEGIVTTGIKG